MTFRGFIHKAGSFLARQFLCEAPCAIAGISDTELDQDGLIITGVRS